MNLSALNKRYESLAPHERLGQVFTDFERVLVTSSFGTTSAVLLSMLHKAQPQHPVHVIDTNYLFPETHAYRRTLTERWQLNVQVVKPSLNAHLYTRMDYTWAHQPDACCHVNKVAPLEALKDTHDIWVSGMIGGLSDQRKKRHIFEWDGKMFRFYPLIDMSAEEVNFYRIIEDLPSHPLEGKGYGSVGCAQCTQKGNGRDGRWAGKNKTECGLHVFPSREAEGKR